MVVAPGATRMSEVPELRIMFVVKDERLVVSASGRQSMKQQEYVFVFRKLLSGWNSPPLLCPACMLGRAAAGQRCSLFLVSADCHSGHWGALPAQTVRATAESRWWWTALWPGEHVHFSKSQSSPFACCGHSRCAGKSLSCWRMRPGVFLSPVCPEERQQDILVHWDGVERGAFPPAVLSVSRKA